TGDIKHKFGIIEEDIISLITNNHEKYWSHCKLIGISTHIGSQLLHLEETYNAIAVLSKLALKIENFTNAPLEMVDVGGGLGIPYTEDEEYISPSVYDYIKNLSQILKDNYLNHRQYNSPPKIVFEPGRILVGRAGVFVASVIRKKTSGKKTFVVVDGGMNDFMRPSLYQAYHRIFSKYFKVHAMENVDVVGPVCETSDQFATECLLPKSIKSGDFIVISDTGAYGYTMASNYNLRGRPAEIIVDNDNNLNIINPAEIWEELR
ncbi:MAG: diaminopimelate decarboxylase, partial [Bacteriovoracia bacterium]